MTTSRQKYLYRITADNGIPQWTSSYRAAQKIQKKLWGDGYSIVQICKEYTS